MPFLPSPPDVPNPRRSPWRPRRAGVVGAALGGLIALLAAPAAQAHGVQWSIGIQLPPVGAVVTSVPPVPAYPVYGPPPVVYTPPPRVVYAPPPPPVVYVPPRVVYAPPTMVAPPVWGWAPPPRHHHGWRDRDRDGIPDHRDRWDDRRGRGW